MDTVNAKPSCEWCEEPAEGTATDLVRPFSVKLSCGQHGKHFVEDGDEE